MHKPFLLAAAAALAIAAASAGAQQQQAPKPEQLIKWRQSAFQVLAWNSARIKAVIDGNGDKVQAAKAAAAIAALANEGLLTLFPAGTETGKGWHDTSVKPELFKDTTKVAALYADFTKQANDLSRVAATGDDAALKDEFAKLGKTCKSCHDDYRVTN